MVAALLLAGMMEGVGLTMLIPLLSIAVRENAGGGAGSATGDVGQDSKLEQLVTQAFAYLHITPTLEILFVTIFIAIALKSIMMLIAKKQVGYTVARMATDMRLALLRSLLVTRWEYYLSQQVGSLANAMATEAHRASAGFLRGIMMTAEFFQVLVYGGIAFMVSWKATLISLVAGAVILSILRRFVHKARKAGVRQTDLLKSMLALLTDTLQSIKPLKAMARENRADFFLEQKTRSLNKALQKQVFNREALRALQEPLMMLFLAGGLYAVLVYWQMPLATVVVLVYLLAKLVKLLNKVQERYQEMAIFESAYWSLQETIQEVQRKKEHTGGNTTPVLNHEIRIDQVNFGYGDQYILRNASLTFPVGMITAIVGPSGSGKTTVVDLVTGLLRPQEGQVWIDDQPLETVNIRQWRRMIGYIPQETLLLHDSVINNITLGDTQLKESDAIDALRAAGAWEFVASMPQGIHSMVGERGSKLSGGQRQRIAIARALVHSPKLLILDEATSALDPESEAAICDTLLQLRDQHTILAISHQPALLKIADSAYRILDGQAMAMEIGAENDAAIDGSGDETGQKISLGSDVGKSAR